MRHPLGTLQLFLLKLMLAGHSQGANMGTLWAPRRLPFCSLSLCNIMQLTARSVAGVVLIMLPLVSRGKVSRSRRDRSH